MIGVRFIPSAVAASVVTLVLSPGAMAMSRSPDNWATRPGPNAMVIRVPSRAAQDGRAPAGFSWGDAGVGVVATLALTLAALGRRTRKHEVAA